MSKIEKKDFLATDMILRQVAPLPVAPIAPKTGIIGGFFDNWKLEQREKSTGYIRRIAENQNATTQAYAASMITMMTFQERFKTEMVVMETQREIAQEELNEKRFKNNILFHEAKSAEIDYKIKLKNYEELNGTPTGEDSR